MPKKIFFLFNLLLISGFINGLETCIVTEQKNVHEILSFLQKLIKQDETDANVDLFEKKLIELDLIDISYIDKQNKLGINLFMQLCVHGKRKYLEKLLLYDIRHDLKNNFSVGSKTGYELAILNKHENIVKLLEEYDIRS